MMAQQGFPDLPPEIQENRLWQQWWISFKAYLTTNLFTQGDIAILTKQKGLILTNAAGTVTKRIRLNDIGDGIIIEDI